MRGVLLFLAVVMLAAGAIRSHAGSEIERAFEAANKLYAQSKFAEAATNYQKLIASGPVSPALFFNLGNAYFKSGQLGRAIGAYRQASAITPRDPDIRANLRFARNHVQGSTLRFGPVQRTLGKLSLNEWVWLCVAGFWGTFGLLALRQIKPALGPALRLWTVLAGLVTALLGAGTVAAWATNPARDIVVVCQADSAVRGSPFDESSAVFTAHDGAELRVLDRKDNWLQITDGAGRVGWLKSDAVVW